MCFSLLDRNYWEKRKADASLSFSMTQQPIPILALGLLPFGIFISLGAVAIF